MVTVFPDGTFAGAVYVVVAEFPGDVVGLKVPQPELPHETVQLAPAAVLSLLTIAVKLTEAPTAKDVGGFDIATVIPEDAMMVIDTEADFVMSATDVADTVTVFPVGTAAGAVKVVLELLPDELVGLTAPQAVPPQCTVQVTPAPVLSPVTTAVRVVVAPTVKELGELEILTDIWVGLLPEFPLHAISNRLSSVTPRKEAAVHAHLLIAKNEWLIPVTFAPRIRNSLCES